MANLGIRICTSAPTAIIDAYARWVADLTAQGWDAYLATLMFHDLPGSMPAQIAQMHHAVTGVYSRLATRVVRKPRSPIWAPLLPRAVFAPDLPVPKRRTTPVHAPAANDGLHLHGVLLANRFGRLKEPLDEHFEQKQATYLTGRLRTIDLRRIEGSPDYVINYALKGLKRQCFSTDDLLVLPRALGELRLNIPRGS